MLESGGALHWLAVWDGMWPRMMETPGGVLSLRHQAVGAQTAAEGERREAK